MTANRAEIMKQRDREGRGAFTGVLSGVLVCGRFESGRSEESFREVFLGGLLFGFLGGVD